MIIYLTFMLYFGKYSHRLVFCGFRRGRGKHKMKMIINLDQQQTSRLNRLLERKKYGNAYQFVKHSIDTLLEIEEGDYPSETIRKTDRNSQNKENQAERSVQSSEKLLPEMIRPRKYKIDTVPTNRADDLWQQKERDKVWIWGQINSILAVKYCVRSLASMLDARHTSFIPLELFTTELRNLTTQTKEYLHSLDEIYQRDRDFKYSRSFPNGVGNRNDVEKSRERFETQYIGKVRKNGWVDGAISLLGFARLSPEDLTLGITDYGLAFAEAKNPVFDEPIEKEAKSVLSDEEVEAYLKAVREFSVAERNSLSNTARLIAEGNDNPKRLDCAISGLMKEWTPAQVTTHRVGAVARLADLRVLSKEKIRDDSGKWTVKYIVNTEKMAAFSTEQTAQ